MTDIAFPSRNTANDRSLAGLLNLAHIEHLQGTDDMLPCRVISYTRSSNMALVQPMIDMIDTKGDREPRAQVLIPALQLGGGGFVLSFPINAGDLGWIKANDADISIFRQTFSQSPAATQRLHHFSSAVFIPDTMFNGVTVASEDANSVILQNLSGTVKIALGANSLNFRAPASGIGGDPNTHAILDLQSTTQAFIPPRMTTAQRNAIPSPVEGMLIWNLDVHAISTYNGSSWS